MANSAIPVSMATLGIQKLQSAGIARQAPRPCARLSASLRASRFAPIQPGAAQLAPTPLIKRTTRKNVNVIVNSAAGAAPAAEKPFKWGADMKNLSICVGLAAVMWFIPPPAGVALKAWHLLAIFTGAFRLECISGQCASTLSLSLTLTSMNAYDCGCD